MTKKALVKLIFSAALLTCILLGSSALAQEAGKKHWKDLPEAKRKELREKYERYKKLSPEQKKRVRENHKRFKDLPPEEQKKLSENYKKFKTLSPEERKKRLELWRKRRAELKAQQQGLNQQLAHPPGK